MMVSSAYVRLISHDQRDYLPNLRMAHLVVHYVPFLPNIPHPPEIRKGIRVPLVSHP
jgi:hypothetical protein